MFSNSTSNTMGTLASGASSMPRTRPIEKSENVKSMQGSTPSELSVVSTSALVAWKTPRAIIR